MNSNAYQSVKQVSMTLYFTLMLLASLSIYAYERIVCSAYRQAKDIKRWYPKFILEIAPMVALISSLYLVLTVLFIERVNIPSPSMMPAFKVGQTAFINKLAFNIQNPFTQQNIKRLETATIGQPVITRLPYAPDTLFIKRVWGLPGDVVSVDEKGITINDIVYPFEIFSTESYDYQDTTYNVDNVLLQKGGVTYRFFIDRTKPFKTQLPLIVPKNQYFVLGDNLTQSSDSRVFGTIHQDNLIGALL